MILLFKILHFIKLSVLQEKNLSEDNNIKETLNVELENHKY